ncbi:MAG: hypothetical protein AB7E70_19085 [Hyphomicrobiaceae bacterium]
MSTIDLSRGSIAFVAVQADNRPASGVGVRGDRFAFVLLHDVKIGTEIYFTDNGWKTNGTGFKTSENLVRWTASADYAAGTIIEFVSAGTNTPAEFDYINPVTGAIIARSSGSFGLSTNGGDQVIAFQGATFGGTHALMPHHFLAAVLLNWSWDTSYTNSGSSNDSGLPPGLTNGLYSVILGNRDNARISDSALATLTGSEDAETLRNFFNNSANWVTSNSPFSPPAPTGSITVNYPVFGTAGDDVMTGTTAYEMLLGGAGDDLLVGGDGWDRLYGEDGDDVLRPGDGGGMVYGGDGIDTIDYSDATAGVTVKLHDFEAIGADDLRTFVHEVENVTGSAFADRLYGDAGGNVVRPGTGADIVYGQGGIDTIDYSDATAGVRIDIGGSYAIDAGGATDRIYEFENAIGSAFADRIYGSTGDNVVRPGTGSDILYGLGGIDTVDYSDASAGVRVELFNSYAIDGGGATDYLSSFENIVGSAFADRLYGSAGDNVIRPGDGADYVYGMGGRDTIDYSDAGASVRIELNNSYALDGSGAADCLSGFTDAVGSVFADRIYGTADANVLSGLAGGDVIYGLAGDDMLLGGDGDDKLIGGDGNDTLTGGDGADRFYFVGTESGADVILDFISGVDEVYLREGGFGSYSVGDTAALFAGTGSSDAIFGAFTGEGFAFDTTSGALYFDQDGSGGAHAARLVATLQGVTSLTADDLVIYTG